METTYLFSKESREEIYDYDTAYCFRLRRKGWIHLNKKATKLIERNTTVPTSKSQTFSTAADNQTSVEIHVVQGEREMSQDNKSLGRFILSGIPPSPRGVPQVEVTFDIDANGILHVSAKDNASGKEQKISITGSSGLSEDEVSKMQKEAESNAEADKEKKESVEVVNQTDMIIYQTEKTIKEAGEKVEQKIKDEVQTKLDELKKAKEAGDIGDMKKKLEEMNEVVQKIGQAMYAAQQSEAPKEGEEKTDEKAAGGSQTAEDADFTEKSSNEAEKAETDDSEKPSEDKK